ncbi:MAG TPA: hypothetical protein VKD47_02700 [Miltoncostaeaceae bacterium]|nr:hypothetical protein [Miltoncostaeaceae bacterium]
MAVTICRTCAVEHAERADACAICEDERQWTPASGQAWATLDELAAAGTTVEIAELEPCLFGITTSPGVGIGQQSKLLRTDAGNLLWDPIGYLDDDGVALVRSLGPVAGIAASHPHMFGVQVEWSRRLGGVPVHVSEADLAWVARPDPAIRPWSGRLEPVPGVALVQLGGHFPGSSVVRFTAPDGAAVVLTSDTVYVNPDQASVAFMRSYPNNIPLSAAVVRRLVEALDALGYDRLYGNFDHAVTADARAVVHRSAERHAGWLQGDFDGHT